MAVVVYHFWPTHLSGGYVGVDVFFVISGFLITSHMFREVQKTGRLSLVKFWARRIRRLLPASIFVLLITLAGVFLWVPQTLWETTARQVAASALYVQNWALASDAVDYSAQHNDATAVQHFWSLSVEEQFYVFWPLILLGLLYVASRLTKYFPDGPWASPRVAMVAGLSLVGAASFAWSIVSTAQDPSVAYFATPTRVWEFAGGALLALTLDERQLKGIPGNVLAWLGLGLVVFSALYYTSATPFPGWTAAVPVAGTMLVIAGAGSAGFTGPRHWLSRRPATFLGDVSYGIYLWHWPLLVIGPFAFGHPLETAGKVGLFLAGIGLAWVTKVLIEDPLRTGALLRSNLRTYLIGAGAMATIVGLSFALTALAYAGEGVSTSARSQPCYGPGALNAANKCGSVAGQDAPAPGPALVAKQNTEPLYRGCQAGITAPEVVSCDLGVSAGQATATVAIVGDSHATAWFPAMDELAAARKWHVKTYTKSSCPATTARRILPSEKNEDGQRSCLAWNQKVNDALTADKSISTVFTAAYSTAYSFASPEGRTLQDPAVDGFEDAWRGWMAAGKRVVAFDDAPRTNGQSVPTCLAKNSGNALACALPRSKAYPGNTAIGRAGAAMVPEGVKQVSLREQFCDQKLCYPVVGSVIVFRDNSHISAEYSRALVPYISRQL